MSSTTKLNKDENGKPVDEKRFKGMIRSLLYLIASRANIMFATCFCAHFQSNPRESHLNAIKIIFKYELISYSDVDFVGSLLDRKRTLRTYQFLG